MPRIVDYPIASWESSLRMAEAVYALGDDCSPESCASQMGMKPGTGGFNNIKNGAVKFGLIQNEDGKLSTTKIFKDLDVAYDPAKKQALTISAFLTPVLFRKLWEKYRGKKLPVEILGKILAADFEVNKPQSDRVAGYFINGAKTIGLLASDNILISIVEETEANLPLQETSPSLNNLSHLPSVSSDVISVSINGAGIQSTIIVQELEDLDVIDSMLSVIKRKITKRTEKIIE